MNLTREIEIEDINDKIKFHLVFNQIQLLILYESRHTCVYYSVLFCNGYKINSYKLPASHDSSIMKLVFPDRSFSMNNILWHIRS